MIKKFLCMKEVKKFEKDILEKIYAKAEKFGISEEELNRL